LRSSDPWERIQTLDPAKLRDIALAESIEVAAVLISKLSVDKAAALLGKLPGDRARRITFAVSMTANVTPDAVARIGHSIVTQLDEEPERAFNSTPVERVGAILNYSATNTRDDVLTGLEETDAQFAEAVRKAIFTFADIPERVTPLDVPKLARDVDQAQIVTAMAGAAEGTEQTAVEFLLSNMSKRMAQTLREEVSDRGQVARKDGEAAQSVIVAAIRDMVASGEITLRKPDEED
ncbi:MAG: FliG C-terminal domain-containing protein, partial [Paracoccaceae bacterium]